MVTIEKVSTKKQQREFLNFPLRMYKDNPCFVPPLYLDEKKIFNKNYIYNDTCETVYFLALRDGKTVGRISGILQKASNEKRNEKRIRFTRFDAIDDVEVAKALFAALEEWGASLGMDAVCGPLGFSDLEREGLLIEGFEYLATFEEQYNADYYGALIEACGYRKEVDWLESRVYPPAEKEAEEFDKMSKYLMQRYHLHMAEKKSVGKMIDRYADELFDLLDVGYEKLYGTVPFTDRMKKTMISNFRLFIRKEDVELVLDENDKLVCMGLGFPSLGEALVHSSGRLTPLRLFKLIRAMRHPKVIDMGLIAVDPAYLNKGISAVMCDRIVKMMKNRGLEYCETNLNLEDNFAIRNMWKRFPTLQHKRRRSYVKEIGVKEGAESGEGV